MTGVIYNLRSLQRTRRRPILLPHAILLFKSLASKWCDQVFPCGIKLGSSSSFISPSFRYIARLSVFSSYTFCACKMQPGVPIWIKPGCLVCLFIDFLMLLSHNQFTALLKPEEPYWPRLYHGNQERSTVK